MRFYAHWSIALRGKAGLRSTRACLFTLPEEPWTRHWHQCARRPGQEVGMPPFNSLNGLNGNLVLLSANARDDEGHQFGRCSDELRSARTATSYAFAAREMSRCVLEMAQTEAQRNAAAAKVQQATDDLRRAIGQQDDVEKKLNKAGAMLYLVKEQYLDIRSPHLWTEDLRAMAPAGVTEGVFTCHTQEALDRSYSRDCWQSLKRQQQHFFDCNGRQARPVLPRPGCLPNGPDAKRGSG